MLFKTQFRFLQNRIGSRQRSLGLSRIIFNTFFSLRITTLVASSVTLFLSSLFLEDLLSRLFSREKLHFLKYVTLCSVPELLWALFMIVCLFE